jgi:uncharacterized protein YecE (DUF72 family)
MNAEDTHHSPKYSCHIQVGTSGYSYAEWADAGFYPPDMTPGRMLTSYARIFSITELNYTWYQMPRAQAVERMLDQVSPDFNFAAKLTRYLTHEIDEGAWRGYVKAYREGMAPMIQSGQLAAILLQFPPSFHRTPKNRYYLAALLDELGGLPIAVEFRHASWATDSVYTAFERRGVALVCVDAPAISGLFPRVDIVTSPDLFYIRFHGRNIRGWRSGNMQKQFNYDYADDELREWADEAIERMAGQARRGLLFFNNHVRAQAPRNALKLIEQLAARGLVAEDGRQRTEGTEDRGQRTEVRGQSR